MATRGRTVQLDPVAYGRLEAEARRRRVEPDELASKLVREHLPDEPASSAQKMRDALDALDAVRAQVRGPVDAVALVREGREELARRTDQWLSS